MDVVSENKETKDSKESKDSKSKESKESKTTEQKHISDKELAMLLGKGLIKDELLSSVLVLPAPKPVVVEFKVCLLLLFVELVGRTK